MRGGNGFGGNREKTRLRELRPFQLGDGTAMAARELVFQRYALHQLQGPRDHERTHGERRCHVEIGDRFGDRPYT